MDVKTVMIALTGDPRAERWMIGGNIAASMLFVESFECFELVVPGCEGMIAWKQ